MVVGISAVIIAFLTAGIFTYDSFKRVLEAMDTISQPEAKLVHLNEVMTEISNAEGSARAYTLTKEQHYLRTYWERFSTIDSHIQTLQKDMQSNAYQLARIDSVSALLRNKQRNLQSFLLLKDKEAKNAPLKKALKIIDQKAKDSPVVTSPPPPVDSPVRQQRRREVGRRNSSVASSQPKGTDDPSSPVASVSPDGDTGELLNDVKDIIHTMENEESKMKQYLGKQELDIIEQDWLIMDQIRSIIRDVRREELAQAEMNSAEARAIATRSVITITIIGGLIILGCFIFLAMVFKDLTLSNYYRTNLMQSKRRAEKLAQVKEEFLANMSHEIRTPLNAITGFLAQLQKTPLNQDQRLYVDTLETSSDHLLSIVNDILDLSKIESGKLTIEEEPFTVRKVMQTVVDVMRVKAQEKDITITREVDAALDLTLSGDAHRLRQILFNLVGNAVKFTKQGGVSVRARAKEVTETHVGIEFSVQDTGSGIASNKLDHIFGAFNQEDGFTGQRYGGTGLGLAICKKLVELQNGWISVESMVGQGSIFSFYLTYPKSTLSVPSPVEEAALPTVDITNRSVLVVDDDQVNRLLLEVLSDKWDAQVDIVDSGFTALEMLKQQSYDMILADINMPEMDGVTLMHAIKKDHPSIPVIAFTATANPETLENFLSVGFDDYLIKPFKESDLLAKIAQYTSRHSGQRQSETQRVTTSHPAPPTAYSLVELTSITRNNTQQLIDILEFILSRCPPEVKKLVDDTAEHQWSQVAAQAHKLRSSFGQIGAIGLVDDLRTIEAMAKKMEEHEEAPEIHQAVHLFRVQAQMVFFNLRREVQVMGELA